MCQTFFFQQLLRDQPRVQKVILLSLEVQQSQTHQPLKRCAFVFLKLDFLQPWTDSKLLFPPALTLFTRNFVFFKPNIKLLLGPVVCHWLSSLVHIQRHVPMHVHICCWKPASKVVICAPWRAQSPQVRKILWKNISWMDSLKRWILRPDWSAVHFQHISFKRLGHEGKCYPSGDDAHAFNERLRLESKCSSQSSF